MVEVEFDCVNMEFKLEEIVKDQVEDYLKYVFLFFVGVGFKVDVICSMVVGFEFGMAMVFFDYLDGISEVGNFVILDWLFMGVFIVIFWLLFKDQDKDGIVDEEDNCLKIKGNWLVFGCLDEDGDGVEDFEDFCLGEFGLCSFNGCLDMDFDGIVDWEDWCFNIQGSK